MICTIGAMKKSQKLKKNSIPDQNHDLLYKADKVSTSNNDDVWEGIADVEQEEEVKCFCGNEREFGEMVECEICQAWMVPFELPKDEGRYRSLGGETVRL